LLGAGPYICTPQALPLKNLSRTPLHDFLSSFCLRGGLSVSVFADPSKSAEVEVLAQQIAGPKASTQIMTLARRIAAAETDLRRVRLIRHESLSKLLGDPYLDTRDGFEKILKPNLTVSEKRVQVITSLSEQLFALDRYERRALSRRKFAVREFDAACRPSARCRSSSISRSSSVAVSQPKIVYFKLNNQNEKSRRRFWQNEPKITKGFKWLGSCAEF
jgi:hypothetical protein